VGKIIDVHCHLEFMKHPDKVIKEAKTKMDAIVTSCAAIKHRELTLSFVKKNPGFVFATLGLSPSEVPNLTMGEINDYVEFIRLNKKNIVGIGEVGLDYHWIKNKEQQKETKFVFEIFIGLANELHLPIVIHSRNAMADVFKSLENARTDVVLHCFSGSPADLKEAIERKYWISLATIVCKSHTRQRLIGRIPLENLLLETDSPWLDPFSSDLVNRPWNISFTADLIASRLGMLTEEVLLQTTKNAIKVFNMGQAIRKDI